MSEIASSLPIEGPRQGEVRRPQSLQEVAEEFEAIFAAQLLKVMRQSVQSSGLFEQESGADIQMEMMDQELAREMVRRGGFGLAAQIKEQLEARSGSAAEGVSGVEEDSSSQASQGVQDASPAPAVPSLQKDREAVKSDPDKSIRTLTKRND